MNRKTLSELDYYRIRDSIAEYCVSQEGKEKFLQREPYSDFRDYDRLKKTSREWTACFNSQKNISLHGFDPVKKLFSIIRTEGATLTASQAYALGIFCNVQKDVSAAIHSAKTELNLKRLVQHVEKLPDLSGASDEIFRIIDASGELRDLPEIREIKRNIAAIRRDIESTIKKYASDSSLSTALESSIPVLKADRQVLAVKSSQRSRIKGIIHEVSQSGHTVFIEPEEIVRRNNDLIQEEFKLEQAVRKVFTELTARLAPYADAFEESHPEMIMMDMTQAVARWGMENNCTYALSCGDEKQGSTFETVDPPLLLQARHPLLKERAVPVDVHFISGKRILIITGPNTGGKTVTLKTIALFAMLNQSGFPVPAAEGTRLPCFDSVFADIGDEQSLDESLSTFSGHMKNIATALKGAGKKSLVLLDELGSGTDPQEGSAIAMAALDELIEKGSFVLVTTHHGILKNYGYTHPACINASVEFDGNTLRPTYRLMMGIPGESHALDIAKRSGLPDAIVEKAKNYIATEQADISSLIKGLNQKHSELDKMLREYQKKDEEIEERILRNKQHEINIRQREHDLKVMENKKESHFLYETRKKLENLVRTLKEGEITREKTLEVKGFISNLAESVEKHEKNLDAEERNLEQDAEKLQAKVNSHKSNKKTKKRIKLADALLTATPMEVPENFKKKQQESIPLKFEAGAKVIAKSSKMEGTLLREEKKGMWSVQFGSLKMTVKEKDLKLVGAPENVMTADVSYDLVSDRENKNNFVQYDAFPDNKPVFELRLLGMRCDEGIRLLERQLDLCVIHNFHEFSVIHGKGTGALQQAVQDYLSHYPGVTDFQFAPPEDGGSGKTYVKMQL